MSSDEEKTRKGKKRDLRKGESQEVTAKPQRKVQEEEDDDEVTKRKPAKKQQNEDSDDDEVTRKKKKGEEKKGQGQEEEIITLRAGMAKMEVASKEDIPRELGLSVIENDEKNPLVKPHEELLKLLADSKNQNEFILYKGKRMIHKKILQEYVAEYGKEQLGSIIKRATANQKLILTHSESINPLQDSEQLKQFLGEHSMQYSSCAGASELARGGEAVVFRVEHFGLDEIVAKCTIFTQDTPFPTIKSCYSTIFYETQTLKMLKNQDYMAEIKEEIIELNVEKQIITRYCVIVERAQKTLGDVIGSWTDIEKQEQKKDFFTAEKLTYYFLQSMKGLQYCHDKNLYYGDMKTANLLVFRDQRCKIGDLGISVRINFDDKEGTDEIYNLKGATPGFLPPQIEACVESGESVSKNDLYKADLFALQVTLNKALQRLGDSIEANKEQFVDTCQKKGFPDQNYPYAQYPVSVKRASYFIEMVNDLKLFGLQQTIAKWEAILIEDSEFQIELASHLLNKEYKYQAVKEVFKLSRFKPQLKAIQSQFKKFSDPMMASFEGMNQAMQQTLQQMSGMMSSMGMGGMGMGDMGGQMQQTMGMMGGMMGGMFGGGGGQKQQVSKEEQEKKKKEKELEDRKKKLEAFLSLIEEDDLPELGGEEETTKEKQGSKKEEKKMQWDHFYSQLSPKDKAEWRRITILLIKTYDSDKTNELYQKYKEILIQNEEEGNGNLYFGKRTLISHKNLQALANNPKQVVLSIQEDAQMFEYVLQFLLVSSNDYQKIWMPLTIILQDQAQLQRQEILAKLGLIKSFSEANDHKQTTKFGRALQQQIREQKEYENEYIQISDHIIEVYVKNKMLGEALQEINNLKLFMKQKGIGGSNFYFAKSSMITAEIILSGQTQDTKQQGLNAQQQVEPALKTFQEIFGENSYFTLMAYKILGQSLYIQGAGNQEQAFKYFLKCYNHPSSMLKIVILNTLKELNSQRLAEFVTKFELNDPMELFIDDEVQLVAKGCLSKHFGVQGLTMSDEKLFMICLTDNVSLVSELFSKVPVLEEGCYMKIGKGKGRKQVRHSQGMEGFLTGSNQQKNEQLQKQSALENAIREYDFSQSLEQKNRDRQFKELKFKQGKNQMAADPMGMPGQPMGMPGQPMGMQPMGGHPLGMGMQPMGAQPMGMHQPMGMGMGMQQPMGMGMQQPMGMGMQQPMGMGMNQPMGMGMGMQQPMGMGMNPMGMGMNPMGMSMGRQPTGFQQMEQKGFESDEDDLNQQNMEDLEDFGGQGDNWQGGLGGIPNYLGDMNQKKKREQRNPREKRNLREKKPRREGLFGDESD